MGSRRVRVLLAVATCLGILVAGAAPALAHEAVATGAVSVAQTLGLHELTVTMYPPVGGAGPMPIQIVARGLAPDAPVTVEVVPAGGATSAGHVEMTPRIGSPATSTLQIDHPGSWEVVLTDNPDVARIPLSIPAAPPTPVWAWLVRVGLVAAVGGAIGAAAVAGRRRGIALGLGAVALVGVGMSLTAAVVSSSIPVAVPVAAMDMSGHGAGAVVLTSSLSPPAVDGLVVLDLGLTDGSTGAPVDNLVVHDEALVHLAVVGPAGRLWHVHPVRTAPGRFAVRLPLDDPGRYGVFAETVRADGGHQLSRSAFRLAETSATVDPPVEPVAAPDGAGARQVAGMQVDVAVAAPVAGQASRVELAFSANGQPVRDLQAWLGMAGHLLVLGPTATAAGPDPLDPAVSFAHIHDMQPPIRYGYGPGIGFTYTFPAPGRYQLWAQVQRDWQLITVPITVDVAPRPTGT